MKWKRTAKRERESERDQSRRFKASARTERWWPAEKTRTDREGGEQKNGVRSRLTEEVVVVGAYSVVPNSRHPPTQTAARCL